MGATIRSGGPCKASEFLLTQEQYKQILKFLPPGYSLTAVKANKPLPKRLPTSVYNVDDSRMSANQGEKKKRDAYYKAEQKLKEPIDFIRRCEFIISRLKNHKYAEPFLEPVDPEVLGIPDYFQIIKEPMDFSKVEKRLRSGFYKSPQEFENDIQKIWDNATTYNKPHTEIYNWTVEMSAYFQQLLKEEDAGYNPPSMSRLPSGKSTKKAPFNDPGDAPYRPPKFVINKPTDRPLTFAEKKVLSDMIRQLPSDSLWEVWNIVSPDHQDQKETLEFDIDTLQPKVARQLESFVKSKLNTLSIKKNKSKMPQVYKEDPVMPPRGQGWPREQMAGPSDRSYAANPAGAYGTKPINAVESGPVKNDMSDSSFLSDLSED